MLNKKEQEIFISSFQSLRTQEIIKFTFQEYDRVGGIVIPFNRLLQVGLGIKRSDGKNRPCRIVNNIKYLILIGFFIADPSEGLTLNQDFIPKNVKIWRRKNH